MLPILLVAHMALSPVPDLVSAYLELTFDAFPTRATEAGLHDRDGALEDLSPEKRARFLEANRDFEFRVKDALGRELSAGDRIDARVLLRQIRLVRHEGTVLHVPERDPLYWTRIASDATLSLLLRDELPPAVRAARAADRAEQIPRLLSQARRTLTPTSPTFLAPDLCRLGAGHARALASYYRGAFADAARGEAAGERARLVSAGARAAVALEEFARLADQLAERGTGTSRLGAIDYQDRFRLVTGSPEPIANVLERAERALSGRRAEAAAYGRGVWPALFEDAAPTDDGELLARLFARVAEDRAAGVPQFVERSRAMIAPLEALVRRKAIVSLPDPLTLLVGPSPSYLLGQSVGGVHPAGPYSPDAQTLFLLPVPREGASPGETESFFRDFNDHFMRMITAHELLPGHYVQAKRAARGAPAVRSVFPNGVFVEGWGTFCERLMLDAGWGGPLDRLAHLKKRIENAARAVVDIRIHTARMTREEAIRLFREDALQDEAFAENAWTRSITTAPQLTTYFLGEEAVSSLYDEACALGGPALDTRAFLDAVLDVGPVTVPEIRAVVLGEDPP